MTRSFCAVKNGLVLLCLFGSLGCAQHQSVDEFAKCGDKGPIKIELSDPASDDKRHGMYLVKIKTAGYVDGKKLNYMAFLTRGDSHNPILNIQIEFQTEGETATASFFMSKVFSKQNSCIIAQYYSEPSYYRDGIGFSASLGAEATTPFIDEKIYP